MPCGQQDFAVIVDYAETLFFVAFGMKRSNFSRAFTPHWVPRRPFACEMSLIFFSHKSSEVNGSRPPTPAPAMELRKSLRCQAYSRGSPSFLVLPSPQPWLWLPLHSFCLSDLSMSINKESQQGAVVGLEKHKPPMPTWGRCCWVSDNCGPGTIRNLAVNTHCPNFFNVGMDLTF